MSETNRSESFCSSSFTSSSSVTLSAGQSFLRATARVPGRVFDAKRDFGLRQVPEVNGGIVSMDFSALSAWSNSLCEEPPVSMNLNEVGSYRFFGE